MRLLTSPNASADAKMVCAGTSAFPAFEVHKIAILDMRLGNTDRNGSNVLAKRHRASGEWVLTPIDHGYCLPASFEDLQFEWIGWKQAAVPFSEATRAYVAGLDAEADLARLAENGVRLRPECVRVFRACTLLLQKGVAAGLTARELGDVFCRQTRSKSALEILSARALQLTAAEQLGIARWTPGRAAEHADALPLEAYLGHLGRVFDEFFSN